MSFAVSYCSCVTASNEVSLHCAEKCQHQLVNPGRTWLASSRYVEGPDKKCSLEGRIPADHKRFVGSDGDGGSVSQCGEGGSGPVSFFPLSV